MSGSLAALFGAVAMIPAMVGTVEASESHGLTLALCNGGTLSIELPPDGAPPPGTQPCCVQKGCQSPNNRKRIDRAQ